MSEQEMNSYRFTSGQEPSDEMLEQLMKEVAHDAKERQSRLRPPISPKCAEKPRL